MRHYETTFFFDDDEEGPIVSISPDKDWNTIRISSGEYFSMPCITLFLRSEKQFTQFKNSVIRAYDAYWRKKYVT